MQKLFYEYLILYRQLSLPGVGTIFMEGSPSKLDFGNKQILPPSFTFRLDTRHDQPSKFFFDWVSASSGIPEWDAIKALSAFSFELKDKVAAERKAIWENVGAFCRDEKGNFVLNSVFPAIIWESPVTAEKVIREHAEHTLRVGEQEKSSAEMEVFFSEAAVKKDYTWLIALILTGLSVLFAGWYFSEKGFTPAATGNQSVLKPK